jgi:outer membrane protein assembly factor BamB
MRTLAILCALAASAPGLHAATQAAWSPEDFVQVSGPASPQVSFAVRQDGAQLRVAVEVASFAVDGGGTRVGLGLAAGKAVVLSEQDAQVTRGKQLATYAFAVPLAALGGDLKALRLGLAVAWAGGPDGADRQRERLRHAGGAAHGALALDPQEWLPFDLAEYATQVADRKNRIEIALTQPLDGKATVVIEDAATGKRLRNLIGGMPLAKGEQRILWDGLDDHGEVLPPGTYRWRSLSHPGLVPEYLMSFCNGDNTPEQFSGWGPNHTILDEATVSGAWTVIASPMTEGGDSILVLDAQGRKVRGMNAPMGMGMWKIAPAILGDTLYIANDGLGWGDHFDEHDPKAVAHLRITLARFDLTTGQLKEWSGKRFLEVASADAGPGAADKDWRKVSLAGMAALDGRLYLADRRSASVRVLDAASGAKLDEFPLPQPAGIVAAKGRLYALSAGAVVTIDPASRQTATLVPAGTIRPVALAVDVQGLVYLTDAATSTVRVFDAQGKALRTIGKPGGAYAGAYDAERMVEPRGLAVAANGWLWVAEERGNPKRILAWDLVTGKVACEKFGSTPYGGSGAGIDPVDPSRWIGLGAQWKLDLERRTAAPISILGETGRETHVSYVRDHGITYLIGFGAMTTISRLDADGSAKPVALIASTHRYSFVHDWKPPQVFIDAFAKAYPGRAGKHGDKGPGFLWTDANGDGLMQVEEFSFSTSCENFAGGYFGHDFHDLTLRVPATVKGRRVIVTLAPQGFTAAGVPRYPELDAACAAGVPVDLAGNEVETTVDRFGDLICNTSPEMKAFAPDGRLLWTFPNRWAGVHGSHEAPLPEIGVMQGALFYLGTAPLDATSDVFVMNGNHGRFFALTSDGLYLDEFFKDVRMGARIDANLIGGEAFGGCFVQSAKDKAYYLQAGSYRVYRLRGLDRVERAQGTVTISPAQALAAERGLVKRSAATAGKRALAIPTVATAPVIDGKDGDWPKDDGARWDKSGQFAASARVAYDAHDLYLCYDVSDSSPWVNNGKDWTLLFKTGDSVDLQLGTDPGANPLRSGPVPGDLRLLIAPFQGKDIAVLYRHRVPGAKDPVTFTCPWRFEKVDSVTRLDAARIAVTRDNGRYRVEAAIPLADLGLAAPAGRTLKADFGVIFGDPDGQMDMLRSYWSNQNTGLVNDVPGEIMLTPAAWGTVTFGGAKP